MDEKTDTDRNGGTVPCPICGKASVASMHPFCSRRCADVDLHRWLAGSYAVPAESLSEDEADYEPRLDDKEKP